LALALDWPFTKEHGEKEEKEREEFEQKVAKETKSLVFQADMGQPVAVPVCWRRE
jgi:hypothetical protein